MHETMMKTGPQRAVPQACASLEAVQSIGGEEAQPADVYAWRRNPLFRIARASIDDMHARVQPSASADTSRHSPVKTKWAAGASACTIVETPKPGLDRLTVSVSAKSSAKSAKSSSKLSTKLVSKMLRRRRWTGRRAPRRKPPGPL